MKRTKDNASYLFAALAYLVLASVFTVLTYLDQKKGQDRWTNTLLQQGVESMSAALPSELHTQALDGLALSVDTEKQLAFMLGDLARSHGLAYLYTLIQTEDGQARFVVSSPSPEEIDGNKYESAYLTDYPEMNAALAPIFASSQDHYLEYTDRWGDFRSIFRVAKTPDGRPYLLGADIDIAEVKKALYTSIIKTIGMLLLLFVVSMPLLFLIHQARQRELKNEINSLLVDPMTRLRNRVALGQDIKTIKHPQLLLLDILKFSDVNNAYGPARADQIICHFAKHLARFSHPLLKPHQTYRLHGDEFAILIDQEKMPREIDDLFRDFLVYISAFEYKVSLDESVRLKVTAGVVLNRQTDFITSAKIALHTAREQDRSIVLYSEDLPQASGFQKNLSQLKALQQAIAEKRLIAWFQPIFHTETMEVISYEALARIVDHKGDVQLMPNEFLPVSHRYQIYYKVTREILGCTIEWLSGNNLNASINLSIRDIEHRGTREHILRTIHKSGMGHRLSFELLESDAISDLDLTLKFFGQLSRLGCRLGIDDLGKEYSNFDRLIALPLDFIKLDGGVIHTIGDTQKGFSVVENIVMLAHQHNIKVTAEAISTERYLDVARQLKCDHIQGYYVGVPSLKKYEEGQVSIQS